MRHCLQCGQQDCTVCEYTEDRPTLTLAEFLAKYGEEERAELDPKKRPDGRYEVAA